MCGCDAQHGLEKESVGSAMAVQQHVGAVLQGAWEHTHVWLPLPCSVQALHLSIRTGLGEAKHLGKCIDFWTYVDGAVQFGGA